METVAETDRETRFVALAGHVGEPLRRYVVRRCAPDSVDDVLADVFLVLWRRLDDVPADDPLPWSYGVARRCLANAVRSRRRQLHLVERLHAEPPPAYDRHDEEDHGDDVRRALAQLGDLDREVVMLWAWEGLPPREIALVTGLTPNAVSIRLHRAKARLADVLRKDPESAGQEPGEGRRP